MIMQQQQQQQQQQVQQSIPSHPVNPNGSGGPYTQRNANQGAPGPSTLIPQQPPPRQNAFATGVKPQQPPQFIKPGSVIPPGYIQTIHSNGMPQIECVETGTINFPYGEPPLPPIIILRNHDNQLIQLEGQHNDVANQLAHLTSRVNNLEGGVGVGGVGVSGGMSSQHSSSYQDQGQDQDQGQGHDQEDQTPFDITLNSEFITDLTGNQLFITNVVENIMKNTNLSDLVNEIEPIKADNRELRSLVMSQQEMLNGMNALLFKLLNRANDCVCTCACALASDEVGVHHNHVESAPISLSMDPVPETVPETVEEPVDEPVEETVEETVSESDMDITNATITTTTTTITVNDAHELESAETTE